MRRVLNIAHRGGAGLWPENTMAAFENALAMGCDGSELDTHLSKDGELIVFHDEALKPEIVRDAQGRWLEATGPLVKDLTVAELRQFDVGRLKPGTAYASRRRVQTAIDGERIPLLRDVIRLSKRINPKAQLWIELKTALLRPERSATPQQLAEAVVALLRAEDFVDRAVLVAFDWNGLVHAKRLEPRIQARFTTLAQSWFKLDWTELKAARSAIAAGAVPFEQLTWIEPPASDGAPPKAFLDHMRRLWIEGRAPWEAGHSSFVLGLPEAVKRSGGDGWFPYHPDFAGDPARETLSLGLSGAAWTVDDPIEMRRLIGLGCDAICTDRPDVLKALSLG